MTPEEVDAGIALVRDWLDDYPEGTVIALFEARAWEVKGYADWDALCAAEFPRKVQLPRPERREIVGRLRAEGMSTRAIASAVGVAQDTVRRDLEVNDSAQLPERITGLDGKSRPAVVTTRTTETTEVVDLDTGEILNEVVTSEVWEAENGPTIEEVLASDPDVRAQTVRANFSRWLTGAHSLYLYDAAELAAIAPDMAERIHRVAASVAKFSADFDAAAPKPTPLRVIKEA